MRTFYCECESELSRLRTDSDSWTACEECGRESTLDSPDKWKHVIGLTVAALVLMYAGWDGHWAWKVASVACFAVAGRFVIYQYEHWEGLLSTRSTKMSDRIERLTERLDEVEKDLADADQRLLSECERVRQGLEKLKDKPRLAHQLHGRSLALCATISSRLGNVKDSRAYFDNLSELPDKATPAYWMVYHSCMVQEASDSAVSLYLRVLRKPKGSLRALARPAKEALREVCSVSREHTLDELNSRIRWNQQAAELLPEQDWPSFNEASANFELGRFEECLAALDRGPASDDDWPREMLRTKAEFGAGQDDSAAQRLARLEKRAPELPDLALEIALLHFRQGNAKRVRTFIRICDQAGGSAACRANVLRARIYLNAGQIEDAQTALMVAVQYDFDDPEAVLLQAGILSQQERDRDAARLLTPATVRHPRNARLFAALGRAWWNAGKLDAAAEAFGIAVRNGSASGPLAVVRAQCLMEAGDFQSAADVLGQAAEVPEKDRLMAAFCHGVALLKTATENEGQGASRALPYFTRARRYARQQKNEKVARKATVNLLNCYWMVAQDACATHDYAEAATAWLQLSRLLKAGSSGALDSAENAAEMHFRAAAAMDFDDAAESAIKHLRQSLELRESEIVRLFLGALLFRTQEFSEARDTFSGLAETWPDNTEYQFFQALAAAHAGDSGAMDKLRTLQQQSGQPELRMALAIAELDAAQERYADAARLLASVLRAADADSIREDTYFGECCCRAALYMIRAGQSQDATRLVNDLLGDRGDGESARIIGAILSEAGQFRDALDALRDVGADENMDPLTGQLLSGVAVRVAMEFCLEGSYAEAKDALSGALTGQNKEVSLFWNLLNTVTGQSEETEISEQTVRLLDQCGSMSDDLATLVSRPYFVGTMLLVRKNIRAGNINSAEQLAERAVEHWRTSLRPLSRYWDWYLKAFNEGKDYQLDETPERLLEMVAGRLTGFWLEGLKAAMDGDVRERGELMPHADEPDYDSIRFFYRGLKSMVGAAEAEQLGRQHLDLQDVVLRVQRAHGNEEASRLASFLQAELFEDESLTELVAGQISETIMRAVGEFDAHEFRRAVQEFLGLPRVANLRDQRSLCSQISRLANNVQDRIFTLLQQDSDLSSLRTANPAVHRSICFNIIVAFAFNHSQVPGGIQVSSVSQYYDALKGIILEQVVAELD